MTDKIWRDIVSLRESMALMQAKTKWPPICKRHFQMHFLEWKPSISKEIPLKYLPSYGLIDDTPVLV